MKRRAGRSKLGQFVLLTAAAVVLLLAVGANAGQTKKVGVEIAPIAATDGQATEDSTVASSVPEFVATNEWQELLPGQGVPRGLHVRLNLETGKREARLVDPSEAVEEEAMRSVVVDKDAAVTVATDITGEIVAGVDEDDALTVSEDEAFNEETAEIAVDETVSGDSEHATAEGAEPNWNHEKIYEVLQALPEPPKVEGMDIHDAHEKLSPAEFRQQIVTLWKKRQAELKEALESLQDDAKYLGKLLDQFKDAEQRGDTEGQLSVLEVLEWEVQDLDKTHVFNFIGGFTIMAEYLNSTNLPVRASAAWVFGSAAKNYKDGQNWAIDAGSVPKLIGSLKLEIQSADEAAKEVLEVKKKAVYALSSIVRSNERGQRLFLLHNGPETLAGLFNDAHPMKLQLKALLFMYDLLAEAAEKPNADEPSPVTELTTIFQAVEWCKRLSTFFVDAAPTLTEREVIELVDAMRHQLPSCKIEHQASGVKAAVESLAKVFAADEETDEAEKQELALFFQDFLDRV